MQKATNVSKIHNHTSCGCFKNKIWQNMNLKVQRNDNSPRKSLWM